MTTEHPKAFLFYRAYANVPLLMRDEICCVVGEEPMSWRVVKEEVENKTKIGYTAIDILSRLKIL